MPYKPLFVSIRTQIYGIALLLLLAWLAIQGLRLYDQLEQAKELKQRELSEQTLAQLSWDYADGLGQRLQASPELSWQAGHTDSSTWLSQHQLHSINLLGVSSKPSGKSSPSGSHWPTPWPRLSCHDSCSLWFRVHRIHNDTVTEWLVQSSLAPLLAELADKGIIAIIQPHRMNDRLDATLSTFSRLASRAIPSQDAKQAQAPSAPVLDKNRLSFHGVRYQVWEHQLSWPTDPMSPSPHSPVWVTFFTPVPEIAPEEWLALFANPRELLFPLLLLIVAASIDATWGKRIRNLQRQLKQHALVTPQASEQSTSIHSDELTTIQSNVASLYFSMHEKEIALDLQSQELRQQTLFDPLTGLYNRQCFMFELNRVIANQQRQNALLSLILFDVNEFKRINSTIGSQQGDLLLQQLAQRMRHILRECDLLCRLNGDLFAILTSDIQQRDNIHILMNKLFSQLQQPLELGSTQYRLQFSAGIVFIQKCFIGASELLSQAEMALLEAKSQGHNRYQLFTPSLLEKSVRHGFIAKLFPQSLLNGQLSLHYQPIYDLSLGAIVGLEAFSRWHHPQEGYISPNEFIPILEESQLSLQWGDWVLEQALSMMYQLDKIGHTGLQITVNLTTRQLFSPSLPKVLERLTLAYHISPDRIILELNEAPLIHDYKRAHTIMLSLHEAGYLLSLDNFGSGYSALGYLNRLPFDYIKLASAFTLKMLDSDIDRQLVSSILQLSHTQGKKVVGERIDNALQSNLLQELGCDQLQGYLISHPLSECDLPSQLEALATKFSRQSHARHHP